MPVMAKDEPVMVKDKLELRDEFRRDGRCVRFWHELPDRISKGVEHFFYRHGVNVAQNPYKWMLACTVIMLICISGLFRFRQEKNPINLWIPPDSDFVTDTNWLLSHYEEGIRFETIILTGNNVLEQQSLIKLNEITKKITTIRTSTEFSWTDVCMKIPVVSGFSRETKRQSRSAKDDFFDDDLISNVNQTTFEPAVHADIKLYCDIIYSLPKACLVLSILDIWNFNSAEIKKDSTEEIIAKINTVKFSRKYGHPLNFTDLLGGVTLDENGRIIAARAVKTDFVVHVNFRNVDMNKIGNDAGTAEWVTDDVMEWELEFLNVAKSFSDKLESERHENENASLRSYYEAGRSYADLSMSTIFQDIDKLCIGIVLTLFYIITVMSEWSWVECRFWLTVVNLVCMSGAFFLTIGICSMFGIPYGPVHTALPFLLLGLGTDDTFVFMASWRQIHNDESNLHKPLVERVGLALSHAGSAITITSFTDIMAFIISATTELPSLRSFCIYGAVGIFVIYLLQITFLVGFFTVDARRIEKQQNGVLPCVVHENFQFKPLDLKNTFSWKFLNTVYSRLILTTPGKLTVVALTIAMISISVLGILRLQQWFDVTWLLPRNSYMSHYINVRNQEFSNRGYEAFILMGDDIDYSSVFPRILTLTERFNNASFVQSVDSWPIVFEKFVSTFYSTDLRTATITNDDFHHYLSRFLISQGGGKYQRNLLFNETFICGKNAPRIVGATIDFKMRRFTGPHEWIPAMDDSKHLVHEAQLGGYATTWSKAFGPWQNDKLIAQELKRNLLLALICVMSMTVVLIAELQTCFWILLCILFTLLDICGFMYFWGMTIDIISCIGLQLAVGLSMDYAAHVAHAFLIAESREGDKKESRRQRALIAVRHIGAAVVYGAGSSWLTMSMLAFSTSYVFVSFYKIFFLAILFGLWHGLVFLPVVLSTVGPRSLRVTSQSQPMSEKAAATDDED